MNAPVYSPSYNLVAAALPFPGRHVPSSIIFAILDSLVTKKHGKVPSLMTLASKTVVESAIADPKKRSEMKKCVEMSECASFNSLIFGNCSAMSQFIMRNLPVHRIPSDGSTAGAIQFVIQRELTQIYISGTGTFDTVYPRNRIPLQRIMQLLRVIFKRDFWMVGFLIDVQIPNGHRIIERVKRVKEEAKSRMENLPIANHPDYRLCQFIDRVQGEQWRNSGIN